MLTPVTYTLPAYWASGLINGDWSGCFKSERLLAEQFLQKNNLPAPVQCSEESYFKWKNDATDIGGDVLEYTFLIENNN